MTKNFLDFLTESTKVFSFKLWFANAELDADQLDKLETALQKYKLDNISKPKSQPTVEHKFFPGRGAVEIQTVDVDLLYPCNATQVYDAVVRAGMNLPPWQIIVLGKDQLVDDLPNGMPAGDALLNSDYGTDSDDGKSHGEKHIGSFLKTLAATREFDIAGGKTPNAKTTNDIPQGKISPVGTNKTNRTVPKTGRSK